MKKLFTFLLSIGSLTTVFAQSGTYYGNPRDQGNSTYVTRQSERSVSQVSYNGNADYRRNEQGQNAGNRGDYSRGNETYRYGDNQRGYDRSNDRNVYNNDRRGNDRERQAEIDRVNRDYNRRIDNYRNNRSYSDHERSRRIADLERERNNKLKSFGGGVILGGILGVLIGSHL